MKQAIQTGDIFRGAYLLCRGGKLGSSALIDGEHVVFTIEGEHIEQEDALYREGEALVNPLYLKESLNLLRDIIFQYLKKQKNRRSNDKKNIRRRAGTHQRQH